MAYYSILTLKAVFTEVAPLYPGLRAGSVSDTGFKKIPLKNFGGLVAPHAVQLES